MRNVLTVFIASPSDLAEERKKAFEVVREINETIKGLDWEIDLLGWEDTLPGSGRPQARINRDVERCELFVGMLWRRWGTLPAISSPFTSGFEEEFTIARKRHEETSSPEIWMFFKGVESAQVADPGAQLQSVLKFRESLVEGKTMLYREFDSIEVWEKILRNCLYRYVLDIAGNKHGAPEGPSGRASVPAIPSGGPNTSEGPTVGLQLAEFARSLAPVFESSDLNSIATAMNDAADLEFLAVRGLLLSSALVSISGSSSTLMPTHELNTLYRSRDRLRATEEEFDLLLGTILSDGADVKPGWFWFKEQ